MGKMFSSSAFISNIYVKISTIIFSLTTVWLIAIYARRPHDVPEPTVLTSDIVLPMLPTIQDKVAVIIEDRPLNNLIPLVLHFASVLGPTWPVFIYTSTDRAINLTSSPSLSRWSDQIGIRTLPEGTKFADHDSVSHLLTDAWIWHDLAPSSHVLLFQADSVICANAPQSVDDFISYDFIGAPIAPAYGQGYNGGLSLRNRLKTLELISREDWNAEKSQYEFKFEDQWYFRKMQEMPDIRLPDQEVAMQFAVETIYYDRPLGYHQVHRWQEEHMAEIQKWCPEVALTIGSTFV